MAASKQELDVLIDGLSQQVAALHQAISEQESEIATLDLEGNKARLQELTIMADKRTEEIANTEVMIKSAEEQLSSIEAEEGKAQ